nr:primase C-terminal domain-containing protein [Pseudoalteromonas xiamenensis]
MPDYGLGRNCNLFEDLRKWAYHSIRQGWPDYERWFEAVLTRANGYNIQKFEHPIPESEIRHTSKSVAQFVFKHFSPEGYILK